MRDTGKRVNSMAKVSIWCSKVIIMRANGKTTSAMEKAFAPGKMVTSMLASFRKTRDAARGHSFVQMETNTKMTIKTVRSTARVLIPIQKTGKI